MASRINRINNIFIILLGYAFVHNVIKDIYLHRNPITYDNYINVTLAVILTLFIVLNGIKTGKKTVILQCLILSLFSFYLLIDAGVNSTGVPLLIVTLFYLMHELNLKNRFLKIVMFIVGLLYFGIIISYNLMQQDFSWSYLISDLVLSVMTIYLYWVVFEEDLRKALSQIETNRFYTDIGRNSSMLLHNVKNDIGMLENYLYLIEEGGNTSQYLDEMKTSMEQVQNRISRIKENFVFSRKTEPEVMDLGELAESVTELFRINKAVNNLIDLEFQSWHESCLIKASPSEMRDSLINVINNSLEAIQEARYSSKRKVSVSLFSKDKKVILSVRDNGPGIKDCRGKNCRNSTCLFCNIFKAGKSSKKKGSGQGLIYVMQVIHKYKGDLHIKTGKDEGTLVEMIFPLYIPADNSDKSLIADQSSPERPGIQNKTTIIV